MDELLNVLREEAAREARSLREGAVREAERIVVEARAEAARLREAALVREAEARSSRARATRDTSGLERERALLVEGRRQLDLLREDALVQLQKAVSPADVERFVVELLREAGPMRGALVVDPGDGATARRALEAAGMEPMPEIREADAPRGGVELVTGALVLDDTVASRLERAWPRVEPEIARLLLSEG
jgi:vacuolar-type H+-ATPase subunit E/Vma4